MKNDTEKQNTQAGAVSTPAAKQDFFFAGGTEFEPITIYAESIEEANAEYIKVRKPINQTK